MGLVKLYCVCEEYYLLIVGSFRVPLWRGLLKFGNSFFDPRKYNARCPCAEGLYTCPS